MRRALDREARKVQGAAAGASPGADWPVLYARLRSREIGLVVGLSVGFPVYIVLCTSVTPGWVWAWSRWYSPSPSEPWSVT